MPLPRRSALGRRDSLQRGSGRGGTRPDRVRCQIQKTSSGSIRAWTSRTASRGEPERSGWSADAATGFRGIRRRIPRPMFPTAVNTAAARSTGSNDRPSTDAGMSVRQEHPGAQPWMTGFN